MADHNIYKVLHERAVSIPTSTKYYMNELWASCTLTQHIIENKLLHPTFNKHQEHTTGNIKRNFKEKYHCYENVTCQYQLYWHSWQGFHRGSQRKHYIEHAEHGVQLYKRRGTLWPVGRKILKPHLHLIPRNWLALCASLLRPVAVFLGYPSTQSRCSFP